MSKITESINSRISSLRNGFSMVLANKKHDSIVIHKHSAGFTLTRQGLGTGFRYVNQILDEINSNYPDYEHEATFKRE